MRLYCLFLLTFLPLVVPAQLPNGDKTQIDEILQKVDQMQSRMIKQEKRIRRLSRKINQQNVIIEEQKKVIIIEKTLPNVNIAVG